MASRKRTKRPPPPEVVVERVEAAVPVVVDDWGWAGVPVLDPVEQESFDSVVVSSVPVCEEKTGHVLKMNYFNAAGQLVR